MPAVIHRRVLAVLLAAGLVNPAVHAAGSIEACAANLTLENDLFFGTDRYYTNGTQLEISQRWTEGSSAGALLERLCGYFGCDPRRLLVTRHKVGQLMYTPERITVHEPQPADRPWAGMLYYTQDNSFLSEDEMVLTTISAQIGIVGPNSFAEHAQKWVHRTFTGDPPRGWDNQIGGELGLMAVVERRSAVPSPFRKSKGGIQHRATAHWRVALGNIMTFAGAGLDFVVGKGLPPVIERGPGIDSQRRLDGQSRRCVFEWLECSARASVEARMMLHNIFLDGPVFRDGPSVDSRRFVADAAVSVRLDFPRTRSSIAGPWFVQFRATRRSPEFRSTGPVHSPLFGALTVGTDF